MAYLYTDTCPYSRRLIDKLKSLDTRHLLDFDLINKATEWARKYHSNQMRKSGEPYYTHPLEVAYMISDYNLTTNVIVASILHDIIEDTEVTAEMILDHFGWRIAQMVDRLTRERPDGTKLSVKEILDSAYQYKDNDVLMIKLFDRVHNLYTLNSMIQEKQIHTKIETINLFPLVCVSLGSADLDQLLTSNLSTEKKPLTSLVDQFYKSSGADCLTSDKFFKITKS